MLEKKRSRATIDDVAERASVSIKTVSRVMNQEPNVREKTRDKVLKAAKELNYQPNLSARMLAGDRSYLLGMLYDTPSNYNNDIQVGALARCREGGYNLVVDQCDPETDDVAQKVDQMLAQSNLDGVILTAPLCDHQPLLDILNGRGVPFVRVTPMINLEQGPCVYMDDYQAAYDMTSYLVSLGHKDIGFIKGHPGHGSAAMRYKGFCDALKAHGLRLKEDFVKQGFYSYRSGMAAAEEIFADAPHPTAVFASDDDMAAGVEAAAHKYGLEIPAQLSVVGFDDTPIAEVIWPQLTTIRQPIPEMAGAAVQLLIEGKSRKGGAKSDNATQNILIDFELVERESSSAPAIASSS
ncbi:LacI family DNA-binding transcriptional regulator [Paremcibacter congregatus]|uniref:LacI family DNA-binding transcriptional regulator n=1 Tax=Paremcibacter congregatus TaxID=2043170 RepID=UPI00195CC503|nr:LacI family DNA-binding transcriptional regulator [Paremcibacter congregatus]